MEQKIDPLRTMGPTELIDPRRVIDAKVDATVT